jgi:hypothetical protein
MSIYEYKYIQINEKGKKTEILNLKRIICNRMTKKTMVEAKSANNNGIIE